MDVRTIMTERPVTATRSTLLKDVARMMRDHDVGEIPIVEDGKPVGVVTDRDIVVRMLANGQDPTQMRAEDCMTSPAVTLAVDSDLKVLGLQRTHVLSAFQIRQRNDAAEAALLINDRNAPDPLPRHDLGALRSPGRFRSRIDATYRSGPCAINAARRFAGTALARADPDPHDTPTGGYS